MYSSVNTIWVLLGAAMVFFMQAGFAMCEAGFTRSKNTGNILMKNLMDFCIGTPAFWLVGFGIMFGGTGALIGSFDPLVRGDYTAILPAGVPIPRLLIRKHKKVSKINVFKGREHGTKSKNLILTGTKGADVKISALFLSPRHRQPPYGVFSYPCLYPPEKSIN